MTPQEALSKIKALFADQVAPEVPSVPPVEQFKEYTLADGNKVMIDNLAPGGKVNIEGPEGPVPPPAGDHILADGMVITTDEAGIITEMETPEIETEVETAAMKKKMEEMAAQIEQMKADYEARFNMQKEEFAIAIKASEDKMTSLRDVLVEFFAAPSADPIKPEPRHVPKEDKINRFLQRMGK
jgi:hypothetical protein